MQSTETLRNSASHFRAPIRSLSTTTAGAKPSMRPSGDLSAGDVGTISSFCLSRFNLKTPLPASPSQSASIARHAASHSVMSPTPAFR